MTDPLEFKILVPLNVYATPFTLTVSPLFIGIYSDSSFATSSAVTATTFSLFTLYAGAFTTNVAPEISGIGVVIAALISAPLNGVEI